VNFVDVLFFQAELAPDKLAIVANASIIPYGRLARGILSAERRLRAIGLTEGQTVGISMDHPIDHLVVACALYRMRVASASITASIDTFFDATPFDAVLSDSVLPTLARKQPRAKLVLLDPSWFQDKSDYTLGDRVGGRRQTDMNWISRVSLTQASGGEPAVVRITANDLEEQILSYRLSEPPLWDRMISIAGLQTNMGFAQAISALWLGRSLCMADLGSVRRLSALYKHDHMVVPAELTDALVALQDTDFISMQGLRAASFEGNKFNASTIARAMASITSNLRFRYVHPQLGVVAYGEVGRFRAVEGAVGYVAPWIDLQAVDSSGAPLAPGQTGTLRFRRKADVGVGPARKSDEAAWVYPGQSGMRSDNNLLVLQRGNGA
jgi:hypothetical protein